MEQIEILKAQIESLKELVKIKEEVIAALQQRQNMQQLTQPFYYGPQIGLISDCQHEYPQFRLGIHPPSCIKCGKQSNSYAITCENQSSGALIVDLTGTGSVTTSIDACTFGFNVDPFTRTT